ncbi:hypothetical protein IHD13_17475 [Halomonas sp. 328]|nr:hypothetical protein [Halomonas sp. 328]
MIDASFLQKIEQGGLKFSGVLQVYEALFLVHYEEGFVAFVPDLSNACLAGGRDDSSALCSEHKAYARIMMLKVLVQGCSGQAFLAAEF